MALPPIVLQDPLWARFQSGWKPVPKRPSYAIAIAVVLATMMLILIAYIAVVAGLGYGIVWYFQNVSMTDLFGEIRGRGAIVAAVGWLTPPFLAAVLVLFLIKALFAPADKGADPIELHEFEELKLHSFVHNICTVIGSPVPKAIHLTADANASAGFRNGFISLFVPGDLVLTIGMTLVAGMSKREFAGVLAHEFGHFSQGTGMRVSYAALSIIYRFQRAVWRRDAIDAAIAAGMQHHGLLYIVGLLAQLCVFCARMVMAGIVYLCALPALAMSRQMEYDADRYENQVSGTSGFASAFSKLATLNTALPRALDQCRLEYINQKRVPDNFPAVVIDQQRRLTPETRAELEREAKKSPGLFSTHPSPASRIAATRAEPHDGLMNDDGPASELFGDFPAACKKASFQLFRQMLGNELSMVTFKPVDDYIVAGAASTTRDSALVKFLGYEPASWRPVFLSATRINDLADPRPVIARLKTLRTHAKSAAQLVQPHIETFRTACKGLDDWSQIKGQYDVDAKPTYKELSLTATTRRGASDQIDKWRLAMGDACDHIDRANDAAAARLSAALALLGSPAVAKLIPTAAADRARASTLLEILAALKQVYPEAVGARTLAGTYAAMQGGMKNFKMYEKARTTILTAERQLRTHLESTRYAAGGVLDPAGHALATDNLAVALVGSGNVWNNADELMSAVARFLDAYPDAVRRCLGELCEIALRVEAALTRPAAEPTPAPSGAALKA